MIGKRYGRLTVIKKTDKKIQRNYLYECLCDCGNITYQPKRSLESGHAKSCGCLQRDRARKLVESQIIDGTRPAGFTGKPSKNNSTGYLGVTPYSQSGRTKYKAELMYKGNVYRKKGFKTAKEAWIYRLDLEKKYLPPELRQPPE